ncbi:hypothetical protein I2492_03045 [Budviciaceae bacterium CWB-B4]|uniref:Uncharacterized protein n=1 Tax=Limnobaculum xujianqingii TaxID=2738837 RepID=A0A9D7AFV7_9GAMM|nr:hypothetical protein [Limnobaculum xujianqingii]MBK5071995.1 hypothetical protein [Limnobaculum xujianqingii]MBK5175304.1 hypothetical protein [Limnobaculum xujianqingii]
MKHLAVFHPGGPARALFKQAKPVCRWLTPSRPQRQSLPTIGFVRNKAELPDVVINLE